MLEIESLWGAEEKPAPRKKSSKKKKTTPAKVKDTSVGFRVQLGTCRKRGKDGIREMPILLAKDSRCWILRIGSFQTYPTSLVGVFQTIAQEEALELNADATVEDVIAEQKAVEERIAEMGRRLDKRIREYILKAAKK
jgi:hypothetical protein